MTDPGSTGGNLSNAGTMPAQTIVAGGSAFRCELLRVDDGKQGHTRVASNQCG